MIFFFLSLFLTLKLIYQSPPLLDISKARRWFNPSTLANSFLIRCQLGARPKLVKLSRQLLQKKKKKRREESTRDTHKKRGGKGDVTCLTRQDYSTKCRRTRSFEQLFEGYEPNRIFLIAKPNYITHIFVLSFVLFFPDVVWQWGAARCDPCWARSRPCKGYYAAAQYCPPPCFNGETISHVGFFFLFFLNPPLPSPSPLRSGFGPQRPNLALSPDTLTCQSDKPLHSTTRTRLLFFFFFTPSVQSWNLLPLQ